MLHNVCPQHVFVLISQNLMRLYCSFKAFSSVEAQMNKLKLRKDVMGQG